jgi:hypothetical protein
MSWTGWVRLRSGRFEAVCRADDLGTCSRLLGDIARRRGIKDRDVVMTGGGYP